jgi:hypothetical protein
MARKFIYIFYLFVFIFFILLITTFYFSEDNINRIEKNRSIFSDKLSLDTKSIPYLKNDTNNIILYKDDIEEYKKNRKYNLFWNLIGK